jgi:hypothetical protein
MECTALNTAIKCSALLPLFPCPRHSTRQTLVMPLCGLLFNTVYAVAGKVAKQAAKVKLHRIA